MLTFTPIEDMTIQELVKTYHELHDQFWDLDPRKEDEKEIADVVGPLMIEARWEIKQRGYIGDLGEVLEPSPEDEA